MCSLGDEAKLETLNELADSSPMTGLEAESNTGGENLHRGK